MSGSVKRTPYKAWYDLGLMVWHVRDSGDATVASHLSREHAEFIVRACNNFDSLLSALRRLVRAWETGEKLHNGDPDSFADPIGEARLAIAQAKGGSP